MRGGTTKQSFGNKRERLLPELRKATLSRNDAIYRTGMVKGGAVYIMTNKNNTVLYTGVTSNLKKRIFEHKQNLYHKSFTKRYNINKLVYFEVFHNIEDAIAREKQIKAGSRAKKIALIEKDNTEWIDLTSIVE